MSGDLLPAVASAILVLAAVLGAAPWLRAGARGAPRLAAIGDPVAAGVFLGAGLVDLLPQAAHAYAGLGLAYPWPYVICGAVALLLTMLERRRKVGSAGEAAPALIAAFALSIHSFLAGLSLGVTCNETAVLVLFLALVAHKSAASFSLAGLLAESAMERRWAVLVWLGFLLALPIGVAVGAAVEHTGRRHPGVMPLILSAAAGTFLYFGAMHRPASQATSTPFRSFGMAAGFVLMTLVAVVA